jgi:hypothetical protein
MLAIVLLDVASPGLILLIAGGGVLLLIIVNFVIVLLEGLLLWGMKFGTFKRSLTASFLMNLVSTSIGFKVFLFNPNLGYMGLLIDFALSILIEGAILYLFSPGQGWKTWIRAFFVNLASYVFIILPVFLRTGLLK